MSNKGLTAEQVEELRSKLEAVEVLVGRDFCMSDVLKVFDQFTKPKPLELWLAIRPEGSNYHGVHFVSKVDADTWMTSVGGAGVRMIHMREVIE